MYRIMITHLDPEFAREEYGIDVEDKGSFISKPYYTLYSLIRSELPINESAEMAVDFKLQDEIKTFLDDCEAGNNDDGWEWYPDRETAINYLHFSYTIFKA